MLFALMYLLLRRFVGLLANFSDEMKSDVEVVVLRHPLMVLKRKLGRARFRRRDRLFMAALSRGPRVPARVTPRFDRHQRRPNGWVVDHGMGSFACHPHA